MTVKFETLQAVIDEGIRHRLHTCVQVYISVDGVALLNDGIGMAGEERPATPSTMLLWRSAGKPLTAAGILRLAEQGHLRIDDRLDDHLPAAAGTPLAGISLHEMMAHASGLPPMETLWPHRDWSEILNGILADAPDPVAGTAAYQPQATWFLLGEILRRKANVDSFSEALRQLVQQPLGMTQSFCGLTPSARVRLDHHLPQLLTRSEGRLKLSSLAGRAALTVPSPGGNMRGPVSDLGKFYEMLLRTGRTDDDAVFLSPESVALMMTPHRVGQFDETLQHRMDMGLGLITNSQKYGPAVPYGYGKFASERSVGHGGAQCAMGFCDPDRQLAVAWAANGLSGEPSHQRRNRAINEAIYHDLEFTEATAG